MQKRALRGVFITLIFAVLLVFVLAVASVSAYSDSETGIVWKWLKGLFTGKSITGNYLGQSCYSDTECSGYPHEYCDTDSWTCQEYGPFIIGDCHDIEDCVQESEGYGTCTAAFFDYNNPPLYCVAAGCIYDRQHRVPIGTDVCAPDQTYYLHCYDTYSPDIFPNYQVFWAYPNNPNNGVCPSPDYCEAQWNAGPQSGYLSSACTRTIDNPYPDGTVCDGSCISCLGYNADSTTSCKTSCSSNDDCWSTYYCNSGSCVQDSDSDYDGVYDHRDNCPSIYNQYQEESDGDGVGDVCDNCRYISNPGQEDSNSDGIGDACDCGDGNIYPGEVCDSNSQACTVGGYAGTQTCLADCSGFGACVASENCGDGIINDAEQCDGTNLNGQTCATQGFVGGTLACAVGCMAFDTSGCYNQVCGNGVIESGEQCDDGNTAVSSSCGAGACQRTVADTCVNSGLPNECTTVVCVPGTPTTELCNGIDDDCDSSVDEELGSTTCGLGICAHTVQNCVGGVPQTCDPMQGAGVESCDPDVNNNNGVDENCDGSDLDCGFTCDRDSDGHGDDSRWYCFGGDDCDDNDANNYPGNTEVLCDGMDQDCSGFDNSGTDADGDGLKIEGGLCGPIDNCPNNYNPDQLNSDNNGGGDVCDICPSDASDTCNTEKAASGYIFDNAGGSVVTPDNSANITVPVGALPGDGSSVSITTTPPTNPNIYLGSSMAKIAARYAFAPDGAVFDTPVTVTLTTTCTFGTVLCSAMKIWVQNSSGGWEILPSTCTKVSNIYTCTAQTTHFSYFALVVVLPVNADLIDALATLQGLPNANKDPLKRAIELLNKSMTERYWIDSTHVLCKTSPGGDSLVFDKERDSVYNLMKITSKDPRYATVQAMILKIVAVDRLLAVTLINEAPAGKEKTEALKDLATGDLKASQKRYRDAIEYYKKAWQHAEKVAPMCLGLHTIIIE